MATGLACPPGLVEAQIPGSALAEGECFRVVLGPAAGPVSAPNSVGRDEPDFPEEPAVVEPADYSATAIATSDVEIASDDRFLTVDHAQNVFDDGGGGGAGPDLRHQSCSGMSCAQVQRGTSRRGCSSASVVASEFCIATREPNSMCSRTAARKS